MFECPRCGYETKHRYCFTRHLDRKVICKPIKEDNDLIEFSKSFETNIRKQLECKYGCGKTYKNRCNMSTHYNVCKHKYNPSEIVNCMNAMKQQLQDIQDLQTHQLNNMQTLLCNNPITNNITVDNTIHNLNITINNFGEEKVGYITKEFILKCFQTQNIVRVIEKIHFDDEHPENHNIRIKDPAEEMLEHLEDDEWSDCEKKYGTIYMFTHGYKLFKTMLFGDTDFVNVVRESHSSNIASDKTKCMNSDEWYDKISTDEDEIECLQDHIYAMLLRKYNIMNKIKTAMAIEV